MDDNTITVPEGWRFVGVDPGVMGAMAIIGPRNIYDVTDLLGGPSDTAASHICAILRGISEYRVFGAIEHPQPVPKQSAQSIQTLGIDIGMWRGIFTALGIKFYSPRPQEWKRSVFFGSGERTLDKKASRRLAEKIFPHAVLGKRSDEGRSEALLIAEYARRSWTGRDAG